MCVCTAAPIGRLHTVTVISAFQKKSLKMACRTCFVEWTDAGRRKREDRRQTASIGGITLTRRLC
eukprot:m.143376 g.143376  ORF g.143376 m.143376 type:complete len:65 (+) comp22982_c0_seq1:169-363(+)